MGRVVLLDSERRSDRRPTLDTLRKLVETDLQGVNRTIVEEMQSQVSLIPQLASHIVAAGGKRIRPMLTLGAAQLCGTGGARPIKLAACVEFIHTATLLHDDVVDESSLRRGLETANAVWGNKASVLVGDFLFARAFQLMVSDGSLKVLAILSKASAVIAEGEVAQMVTANDPETTESAYLDVIKSKTAALFSAACRIGAVVADRSRAEEDALESFGLNLGIAFQVIDDVLDYSAHQATLGKSVGDDFKEGKITLPVILAFLRGNAEERGFWRRTLERLEQNDDDLGRAISLMETHDALRDAVARARHYAEMARDALGIFPNGPVKAAFLDAVDFCIDRAY